jgi:dinuclear metal center YbgI/SA1388 family protein
MTVKEITDVIEAFAPVVYQESYDNSGLQTGDPNAQVEGALLTLDVTEEVLQEAIDKGVNLIIAHHPLIFSPLRSLTGRNATERILIRAIKHGINIYACHTNLDNVRQGVNQIIAEKIGLKNCRILQPKIGTLKKLKTYVPAESHDTLLQALFDAGAGSMGQYVDCSFSALGVGTFRGLSESNPTIGSAGGPRERITEMAVEVLVPTHAEQGVLAAMRKAHPYEEVAYELIAISNANNDLGAGLVGELDKAMNTTDCLGYIKTHLRASCVRHTRLIKNQVRTIAVCGGSGSFLLRDAIKAHADIFVTADFKYHQFFEAEDRIVIADIGHYETEQFTVEIFKKLILGKFPNFAVLLSQTVTNPVNYFC